MKVRLLTERQGLQPGDVADLPTDEAKKLLRQGLAVAVAEKPSDRAERPSGQSGETR